MVYLLVAMFVGKTVKCDLLLNYICVFLDKSTNMNFVLIKFTSLKEISNWAKPIVDNSNTDTGVNVLYKQ